MRAGIIHCEDFEELRLLIYGIMEMGLEKPLIAFVPAIADDSIQAQLKQLNDGWLSLLNLEIQLINRIDHNDDHWIILTIDRILKNPQVDASIIT